MKKSSAERKKDKDIHELRVLLSKKKGMNEKIESINRHFNHLRITDFKKALHSYTNFLEMPEALELMNFRYIKDSNSVLENTSYSSAEQTLEQTIIWVIHTLSYFSKEINYFIERRNEFNKDLLNSNFDKATEVLQDIEMRTGKSLWSISSYLNVLFFKNDIQTYNNTIKTYLSEPEMISRACLNYETVRCNRSILPDRYHFYIGKVIEEFRLNGEEKAEDIILYRHSFDPNKTYSDMAYTYKTTYDQRIIDSYCYFIKLVSYLEIHNFDFLESKKYIKKLAEIIKDRDLDVLSSRVLGENKQGEMLQLKYDEIINHYLKCEYESVILKSEHVLREHPQFSVLYIPYTKSLVKKNTDTTLVGVIKDIINLIKQIYGEEDFEKNIGYLSKYYQVLNHNPWATILSCVLNQYNGGGETNIPILFNFTDNTSLYYNVMSLREKNDIYFSTERIPEWRKNKYFAERYYFNKNYEESLIYYRKINAIEPSQSNPKIIQCLYHLGDINKSVKELSEALISGLNPMSLPLVLIADHINIYGKHSKDNSLLISKAIILHYYRLYYSNEYSQTLADVCENYLENLSIDNSNKINHKNGIDNFILEKVLKLEVLAGMTNIIESDIDRLKCRLNINRYILANKMLYTEKDIETSRDEVKDIFYKTVVEICSNEVGEGKIYIDKEGLKNKIYGDVKKTMELISSEKDKVISYDYNENVDVTYSNNESSLSFYSSDKNYVNLILELLYQVYSSYTLDKIYGLDQALNMGIRHGGLVNLLWYPLKNNNLAAVKIRENKFNPSPIWRNLFGYYNESTLRKVDEALISFNTKLNKIVFEIKNNINVNMGEFEGSSKWFNYSPGFNEQIELAEEFDYYNSDTIINKVFIWLDEITESCLKVIQEQHIPALEKKIMAELDMLEKELDSLNSSMINLKRAISKARVEMKDALDILYRWFSWSGESKTNFDIPVAIDKAISAVRQFHSWMNIQLETNIKTTIELQGKFFTDTVMLLTLLFENSVKHSSYKSGCLIKIDVSENNEHVIIKVCNSLDSMLTADKKALIEQILEDLASNRLDNSNKDTGSGLYKVKKILTHHFKTSSVVKISHEENDFIVEIEIKKSSTFLVEA